MFSQPLASDRLDHERLNKKTALAVLSSGRHLVRRLRHRADAACRRACSVPRALSYVIPISAVIVGLFVLVALSYRQTIFAYPGGGGSYTVAKDNLGPMAGLDRGGVTAHRLHPDRIGVDLGRRGGDHVQRIRP